jgi:hypothetical protein
MAWHSLLDARSRKSPPENCVPRCRDSFQAIKELGRLGRPVADLRSWAYETLMRAWLRSGDPGALSEMESLYSYVMMNVSSTESRITFVVLLLEKYNEIESEGDTIPDI